jgi:adenosylmethionine-8-amino-7-oxononanoate aminotransferase
MLESLKAAVVAGFRRAGLVAVVEFVNGAGGETAYRSAKAGSRAKAGTRVHIHIPVD